MELRATLSVAYSLQISHNQLLNQLINWRKIRLNHCRTSTPYVRCN